MQKSPIAIVKERFKNKEGLISAVKALASDDLWIDRLNDDKGLPHVSNKKLLHLHDLLAQVKQEHGSRAKLIEAILAGEKRSKDKEYRTGLEQKATPQLFEIYKSSKKRNKPAAS
jgi:hypothetical protein